MALTNRECRKAENQSPEKQRLDILEDMLEALIGIEESLDAIASAASTWKYETYGDK